MRKSDEKEIGRSPSGRAAQSNPQAVSSKASIPNADGDPAFDKPLPPTWALDCAARNAGYKNWFAVPAFLQTPTNRAIIVEARQIVAFYGEDELVAECRERATYLRAMKAEGLSRLEQQCMETLFKAADALEAQAIEARRAETTGSVHESAVGNADAPNPHQFSGDR